MLEVPGDDVSWNRPEVKAFAPRDDRGKNLIFSVVAKMNFT